MKNKLIKTKKGGLDTIVAYIVVSLPLLYVLIYMVATIYHFSVQMYVSQVVKEATVMASTYGALTSSHENYIRDKLADVFDEDEHGNICDITFYIREFDESTGTVGGIRPADGLPLGNKADIIGISVKSTKPSMLGNVSAFSIFGTNSESPDLYYSAYREEIIRNERPT